VVEVKRWEAGSWRTNPEAGVTERYIHIKHKSPPE